MVEEVLCSDTLWGQTRQVKTANGDSSNFVFAGLLLFYVVANAGRGVPLVQRER